MCLYRLGRVRLSDISNSSTQKKSGQHSVCVRLCRSPSASTARTRIAPTAIVGAFLWLSPTSDTIRCCRSAWRGGICSLWQPRHDREFGIVGESGPHGSARGRRGSVGASGRVPCQKFQRV